MGLCGELAVQGQVNEMMTRALLVSFLEERTLAGVAEGADSGRRAAREGGDQLLSLGGTLQLCKCKCELAFSCSSGGFG